MKIKCLPSFLSCFAFIFITTLKVHSHGFSGNTNAHLADGSEQRLQSIRQQVKSKKIYVASYNNATQEQVNQPVAASSIQIVDSYIRLSFDTNMHHDICCSPSQEFYLPARDEWIPAHLLQVGDLLLSKGNSLQPITHSEHIQKPLVVYALEVDETHTLFVGHYALLAHNFIPIAAGIGASISFGAGGAAGFFGPVTWIGGIVIGVIGTALQWLKNKKNRPNFELVEFNGMHFKNDEKQEGTKPQGDKNNGAQAPGMPTENDGYIPPKRWDGEKVRNPEGHGAGWPDEHGRIWIPTGPRAHRGPHWDVQDPKTGRHKNVLPGGKEC